MLSHPCQGVLLTRAVLLIRPLLGLGALTSRLVRLALRQAVPSGEGDTATKA